MNRKIYKYPLEIKDSQTIDVPAESIVISIKNQQEQPVLYAVVDADCEKKGQIRIECRGTGHMLSGEEPFELVETVLFANGNLVFHFFTHKIPVPY
ncbi:DUF7352 domain-containing protein [Listeria booriae]|uniref:DUF7352 domain-containing protein n=1 Tax=Listeria booriae TaxID=1552123 RepID=UPI0016293AF2|nr:hypothetical protein [Listeria booriae]MBC2100613.1 hypothetical protein [Listeria booriae]MBC2392227.1 hypothetical protein [Listeria booriae]